MNTRTVTTALPVPPGRTFASLRGGSNFTSAMFQQPGVPDGMFVPQYRSLLRGLESVERGLPV